MRRRVTRRLTRLQTMCNVLKYRKIPQNVALRLRCGCVYFFNLLKTSTVTHFWGVKTIDRESNNIVLDAELLGVSFGSMLFAYDILYARGSGSGRVNTLPY